MAGSWGGSDASLLGGRTSWGPPAARIRVPPAGRGVPPSPRRLSFCDNSHSDRCEVTDTPRGFDRRDAGPLPTHAQAATVCRLRTHVRSDAPAAFKPRALERRELFPSFGWELPLRGATCRRPSCPGGRPPPLGCTEARAPAWPPGFASAPVAFANPQSRCRGGRPGTRRRGFLRGGFTVSALRSGAPPVPSRFFVCGAREPSSFTLLHVAVRLLIVAFTEQKFLISIKANLSISSSVDYNFAVRSKKPLPNPRSQSFSPVFIWNV